MRQTHTADSKDESLTGSETRGSLASRISAWLCGTTTSLEQHEEADPPRSAFSFLRSVSSSQSDTPPCDLGPGEQSIRSPRGTRFDATCTQNRRDGNPPISALWLSWLRSHHGHHGYVATAATVAIMATTALPFLPYLK